MKPFNIKNKDSSEKEFKGKLVVFEGLDGAGKTTIINNIKKLGDSSHSIKIAPTHSGISDYWKSYEVVRHKMNEVGTPILESEDQILRAAEFISYASNSIPNLLNEYDFVLTDRYSWGKYILSNTLSARPNNTASKMYVNAVKSNTIPRPDLSIYLKIPPETAHNRVLERGSKLEAKEELSALKSAYDLFEDNSFSLFYDSFEVIDASQSIEIVSKKSLDLMLNLKGM